MLPSVVERAGPVDYRPWTHSARKHHRRVPPRPHPSSVNLAAACATCAPPRAGPRNGLPSCAALTAPRYPASNAAPSICPCAEPGQVAKALASDRLVPAAGYDIGSCQPVDYRLQLPPVVLPPATPREAVDESCHLRPRVHVRPGARESARRTTALRGCPRVDGDRLCGQGRVRGQGQAARTRPIGRGCAPPTLRCARWCGGWIGWGATCGT